MKNNFYYFILVILIILGATIRILAADYNNIWNDEWHTIRFSTQDSLNEFIIDNYSNNISNPAYFLINYFYFKVVPPISKLLIRFPALFFGILSIPLLFFVVRKFFGNEIALTATVLLTFNFFHIHYSKEARPSSLYILLTIISLYYFIKILRSEYNLNNRAKLFLVNALMYWTHPVSIFFIVTEYLFLYLNLIFKQKKHLTVKSLLRRFWYSFLMESVIFIIFVFLKLDIFVYQREITWILKPKIYNLISIYSGMLQYSYLITSYCWECDFRDIINESFYYVLLFGVFLFSILIFSGKKKSKEISHFIKKNKIFLYFLATVILILPFIIFLISQFKPFLLHRYLSFMFIPLILTVSFIFSLLNRKMRYILLLLISIIAIYSSFQSLEFYSHNPSYDELFEHLKETDEKAILAIGDWMFYSKIMLEYYKKNKNFDYNNVISFDNLDEIKNFDGYLYIKSWFLDIPNNPVALKEVTDKFEESLINKNCILNNYEISGTKLLIVRKIICQKRN